MAAPRLRVPAALQAGRGDRPRRLPALGPQRGRRAELHPAAHVREDQEPHLGGPALRRAARARRASSRARSSTQLWAEKKAEMQREGESGPAGHASPGAQPVAPAAGGRRARCGGGCSTVAQGAGLGARGLRDPPEARAASCAKRAELLEGKGDVDWATAESLAFGHAAARGHPRAPLRPGLGPRHVQPAPRHPLRRARPAREYVPLNALAPAGVRFEVHDSLLSEAAVMGFEFGYAVAEHRALVMWEAQFGDFVNGAQVIIDQFLVGLGDRSGASPRASSLLLPHGHEGQGPEHSQRAHRALPDAVRRGQHARRATPRRPRRTSTCCAGRAATPSRSRWW